MAQDINSKPMTLDDLAVMVAKGFENTATKQDIKDMATKQDIADLRSEIAGLRNDVNNYLKLSDQRYLELKARQNIISKWVKQIGDKTGINIDLSELEKI